MATHVIESTVCDLTGEDGASTVSFGLNGHTYEIDLVDGPYDTLVSALNPYIEAARRVGGSSKRTARSSSNGAGKLDPKLVRAWCAEQGIEVSVKGRIPAEIAEKYTAATR